MILLAHNWRSANDFLWPRRLVFRDGAQVAEAGIQIDTASNEELRAELIRAQEELKATLAKLTALQEAGATGEQKENYRLEVERLQNELRKKGEEIKAESRAKEKLVFKAKTAEELARLYQEQALHDGLTGLNNKRAFIEALEREIANARRNKEEISLVMLDLDYFKLVNDQLGHLAGDLALKILAEIIREETREGDFPARYGGEEFAIILHGIGKDGAIIFGERLRTAIEEKLKNKLKAAAKENPNLLLDEIRRAENIDTLLDSAIKGTASLGVATYLGESQEEFIKHADVALYTAKRRGRNQVRVFGEPLTLEQLTQEKERLEKQLKEITLNISVQELILNTFEPQQKELKGKIGITSDGNQSELNLKLEIVNRTIDSATAQIKELSAHLEKIKKEVEELVKQSPHETISATA